MAVKSIHIRCSSRWNDGGVWLRTATIELGMPLTSKQRALLRSEAHHLSATVHVGHQGVTRALSQALDDALRTHELVKVSSTG